MEQWTMPKIKQYMKSHWVRDMYFYDEEHGYAYHAHINKRGEVNCFMTMKKYSKWIKEENFIYDINNYCYGEMMDENKFFSLFQDRKLYMDFVCGLCGS